MVENEQLDVIESEGDGWIRVCIYCFHYVLCKIIADLSEFCSLQLIYFFHRNMHFDSVQRSDSIVIFMFVHL